MFDGEKATYEILFDIASYRSWFSPNIYDKKHKFLIKALKYAISDLTEKQKEYVSLWMDGMSMKEVAEYCGVDKSTVSRTITRAKRKLKKTLKPIVEWNEIFCQF